MSKVLDDHVMKKSAFWSGSMNVLYLIKNPRRKFKSFAANRIGEIHTAIALTQWSFFQWRNTQPAHDAPGTSPEGSLKIRTPRTYRGVLGDSQGTNRNIYDLMIKLYFRSNSPCIKYLFYKKSKYSNILNEDVGWTSLWDRTKWWDVLGTSVGLWSNRFFKIQLKKTSNLLWQITQHFKVNCSSKKSSEENMV